MSGPAARPAYLVIRTEADGTYLGGVMVTDEHGLPVDFRYTDPITPTRLQRALYGGVLDRYLRTEVVMRTLLAALSERPSLLVVDDHRLLEEAGDGACPMVFLAGSHAAPLGAAGAREPDPTGGILLQASEGGHPIRVDLSAGSPEAAPRALDDLVRLGRGMDLLEPAERVRAALDLIAAGEDEA